MATKSSTSVNATVGFTEKLDKMIAGGLQDYDSWRSLIVEIDTVSPEDINIISLAYDSFLSMFPLCHWHLEKYAHHKAKLCGPQEAVDIYERRVGVAMFSVGFWVDYFTFGAACFGDPEDVRRLFGRAISFVDKDHFCHALWDKYLKYEFNMEGWSFLAQSYIQSLRFPTKKLHFYYDNFKQFVANLEEEMGYENNNGIVEHVSVSSSATETSIDENEISLVIKDLLDSSDRSIKFKALDIYRSIGEEFYQKARQMDQTINCFEKKIRRRYFYATPLDDDELNNWHLYLDFIEKQDNMDWAMKLYERCLIPCANYPEFWMRYVDFLESKGGRELAISALDRATRIFLKNVPEIHLFSARFKEHIGDVNGARAALTQCDTKTGTSFIDNVMAQANLERRLGNFSAASATYEKALKNAKEKRKIHVLPSLYLHFAQLTFLTTGSAPAARDVLIEGVRLVPHCRFLLEELIKFAMTHECELNIIDPIIDEAISPGLDEYEGLNAKDRESVSALFLELVNLCGTIHDIRKAWNRHVKLFPQSLRMKTTYKHSTSGNCSIDLDRDQKGQEKLFEFPKKLSPQHHHDNNGKEIVQLVSNEAVILSNEEASQEEPGPMVVSFELADHDKENALSTRDSDKLEQMDVNAELAKKSKENSLSPHESARGFGKSAETNESKHNFSSSCGPKSIQTIVSERDESACLRHSTPTDMNTDEDSLEIDPANASDGKKSRLEKTGLDGPTSLTTPYTQQITNQIASLSTTQQPWQAQALSQMLYHYQQQQLLQQQYQQMQYNYPNQQFYQMPPHQQQYASYQHSQPQNHEQSQQMLGHLQLQQKGQDLGAYQANQLAYQQGQHMLMQQYQQYQSYQHVQHPQQSKEGPSLMHEQQNSTQNMSQNQPGSTKKVTPEYDYTAESSQSPHRKVQSPQVWQ